MNATYHCEAEGYAGMAFDACTRVRAMTQQWFSQSMPRIDVYIDLCEQFNEDEHSGYFTAIDESGWFYEELSDYFPPRIVLYRDWITSPARLLYIVGHEYGHFAHYIMCDRNRPPQGCYFSVHNPNELISCPSFAFREGWAEFYGWVFTTQYLGRPTVNWESLPKIHPELRSISSEGYVAAFLCDLVDSDNDGQCDGVEEPHARVRDVMVKHCPADIAAFENGWQQDYPAEDVAELYGFTFELAWPQTCGQLTFDHYSAIQWNQEIFVMTNTTAALGTFPVAVRATLALPDVLGQTHEYELFLGQWEPFAAGTERGYIRGLAWPSQDRREVDGTFGREYLGAVHILAEAADYAPYYTRIDVVEESPTLAEWPLPVFRGGQHAKRARE
jgi:hypothetical protein